MPNDLDKKIEALLFANGDPLSLSAISKICEVSIDEVKSALPDLKNKLSLRGIILIFGDKEATLGTSPELEEYVQKLHNDEISKPLGKAGLETLSIILYQGPTTKSNVDYIRGVNSATILRNLLIRGLIERKDNPDSGRGFVYSSSMDTLRYLGISSLKELPKYDETKTSLENGVKEAQS